MPQDKPQQTNNAGLFLMGTFKGIQENRRTGNDGQPWVQHFAGIEIPKANGFPGETDIIRVQVPRQLIEQGINGHLQQLIEKPVKADVWVRAYASRSGAGHSLNLSNYLDAIQQVGDSSHLKKAV